MRVGTPTNEAFLKDTPLDDRRGSQISAAAAAPSNAGVAEDIESQRETSVVPATGGSASAEKIKQYRRRRNCFIALSSVVTLLLVALGLGLHFGLRLGRSGGGSGRQPINSPDNEIVKFTVLHLNDLYELDGVQGGRQGGLPRVKTLMDELREENADFKSVLAGDTFSPSAIGAVRLPPDNRLIAGRHMVDALNFVEWDYFTFGNHEFDYSRSYFDERLAQADFTIFSSNVYDNERPNGTRERFEGTEGTLTWEVAGMKVGFVGLCLKTTIDGQWAFFEDPTEVAERETQRLRDEGHDVVILVTHQARADDHNVTALRVPDVDIIMGGHEHENSHDAHDGGGFPDTFKADANARSAYIHRFTFNKTDKTLQIDSEFKEINEDTIPNGDAAVYDKVSEWIGRAFSDLLVGGMPADKAIVILNETLDGTEAVIRNTAGKLSDLVLEGMRSAFNDTAIAIVNGGAIRIDDTIAPGPLTGLDVLRIMPFGGEAVRVAMDGATLVEALEQGILNAGSGAYLHVAGVTKNPDTGVWEAEDVDSGVRIPVDNAASYSVSIGSFLFEVGDANLDMLKQSEGRVVSVPGYERPKLWDRFVVALLNNYEAAPEDATGQYRDYLKSWVEHMDHARELNLQQTDSDRRRRGKRPTAGDGDSLLKAIENHRRLHAEL